MCLSHNAQMLQTSKEVRAKTKLLTTSLETTRVTMGKELTNLQKSYLHLEQEASKVRTIEI